MGDCMCEDYQKAKESRERQVADKHDPYYWWEYPDPFEVEATPEIEVNSGGLARSRKELKERRQP